MKNVWVIGGAGFIGSRIAFAFQQQGDHVVILDGFLPQTGASLNNLECFHGELIKQCIEDFQDFQALQKADVIVDAMAWTSHIAAMQDPFYDLQLNAASHLFLLQGLDSGIESKIIYLGSRGQYGKECEQPITENGKMFPDDIQGIHKTAADSYFRIFAKKKKLRVACLRFPNCYGIGQKVTGDDIGLIGSFIRDAIAGREIEVFSANRYRSIIYADDVSKVVVLLANVALERYSDFNMAGTHISILALVSKIIGFAGSGRYTIVEMPENMRNIDMGDAPVDEQKLRKLIPFPNYRPVDETIKLTVDYFKEFCL